jgi:hypothetical protein
MRVVFAFHNHVHGSPSLPNCFLYGVDYRGEAPAFCSVVVFFLSFQNLRA